MNMIDYSLHNYNTLDSRLSGTLLYHITHLVNQHSTRISLSELIEHIEKCYLDYHQNKFDFQILTVVCQAVTMS